MKKGFKKVLVAAGVLSVFAATAVLCGDSCCKNEAEKMGLSDNTTETPVIPGTTKEENAEATTEAASTEKPVIREVVLTVRDGKTYAKVKGTHPTGKSISDIYFRNGGDTLTLDNPDALITCQSVKSTDNGDGTSNFETEEEELYFLDGKTPPKKGDKGKVAVSVWDPDKQEEILSNDVEVTVE